MMSSGLTLPGAGWALTSRLQPPCHPDTHPQCDSRRPPAQYNPECKAHQVGSHSWLNTGARNQPVHAREALRGRARLSRPAPTTTFPGPVPFPAPPSVTGPGGSTMPCMLPCGQEAVTPASQWFPDPPRPAG